MNERIQELWSKAGGHYDGGNQYNWPQYTIDDPANFAELIVRECAGLMDGRRIEYGNCKDGRVILKHFGVKE
jgi:hypothetical protein